MKKPSFDDISIRTNLCPGDIGMITYLHGTLYHEEFGYGIGFESYVAGAFAEFYKQYNPQRDRFWICEHEDRIIGSILLMNRTPEEAQLRFFLINPAYRNIGLGKYLISQCLAFARECSYSKIYLWTTDKLPTSRHLYTAIGFELIEEKYSEEFGVPQMEQYYELIL